MLGIKPVEPTEDSDFLIDLVQDYALLLQDGEVKQAEYILREIRQSYYRAKASLVLSVEDKNAAAIADDGLYSQVGRLTRDLHESINNFMSDESLSEMTSETMPDARQRLIHVVDLTEKSAHTTMTMIEHSKPLVNLIGDRAEILLQQLQVQEDENNSNAGYLNDEINDFMTLVASSSKAIGSDLNEIMLAQNYQDLTGQIINRVGALVQDVENNLLSLLTLSKHDTDDNLIPIHSHDGNDAKKDINQSNGFGPAVPGVDNGEIMQSQEEVDDLLSSLGF